MLLSSVLMHILHAFSLLLSSLHALWLCNFNFSTAHQGNQEDCIELQMVSGAVEAGVDQGGGGCIDQMGLGGGCIDQVGLGRAVSGSTGSRGLTASVTRVLSALFLGRPTPLTMSWPTSRGSFRFTFLSELHSVGVSGPLQSVHRPRDMIYFLLAMTNSFQILISKVYPALHIF